MAKIVCHLCGTQDTAPPPGEVWECPGCGNMKESAEPMQAAAPVRIGRGLALFFGFVGLCVLVYLGFGWLEQYQNARAKEEYKQRMENWEIEVPPERQATK